MEYLMTYGWAILIIAVVLGALFQLGVFNPANFAPKAQPGACNVYRPDGPYSKSFINLEGVCNGELPEYAANLNQGYITTLNAENNLPAYTLSFWLYPTSSSESIFQSYTSIPGAAPACPFYYIVTNPVHIGSWNLNYAGNWYNSFTSNSVNLNTWSMLTVTLSGGGLGTGTITVYINGAAVDTLSAQEVASAGYGPDPGSIIGVGGSGCPGTVEGGGFQGNIANFQAYNTSLSANEIQALYLEGIGGAPIKLQNLVGWWPLNGNANDYSGNENNGVPTNVVYTSSWTNGYTAP
jgi:hypothetical protein